MDRAEHILLVDDDHEILRGLCIRLTAAGYEVSTAGNGHDGLSLARQRKIDLAILDIRMPGLDGLGMLAQLRADPATANIACIMLTANVAESARRQARELGADAFAEKPYEAVRLLATVRDLLTLKRCDSTI